ncbi:MAG: DUF2845 domain-containing protein [Nitrospirae bacterium]|nr:DUF2845 domain-containing protein [Nitrospirota bacterium]
MRKGLFYVLPLVLVFLTLTACSTAVRYSQEEIKDYPQPIQDAIMKGNVMVGMTTQQVRYAWGPPNVVNVLAPTQEGRSREEWIYSTIGVFMQRRLIFVDGKVWDIFPEPKAQPQAEPEQQSLQPQQQQETPQQQQQPVEQK